MVVAGDSATSDKLVKAHAATGVASARDFGVSALSQCIYQLCEVSQSFSASAYFDETRQIRGYAAYTAEVR